MDTAEYTFATLFQQLGLPSDNDAIDEFIARAAMPLADAPFWSSGQVVKRLLFVWR